MLHVADDRKVSSLTPHFMALTPARLSGITAVAMIMWEPYRSTVRAHVPDADAKIVFDKFHIMQHVGAAVNTVRKQEHIMLAAADDTRLTGTKNAWRTDPISLSRGAWCDFAALRDSTLKSAQAWVIKESLRRLWDFTYIGGARTFCRRW